MYEPLIAKCHAATKNANAAILLYRIAFWMPKAKVSHGGLKWVANSASQWCRETGLSFDQYRRAIARLKTLGLVETEQHLFGGKNVTHVRLTDKGWAVVEKPPLNQGTATSLTNGNSAYLELCENAQLYVQGESFLESHQGDSNKAFASAHANCSVPEQDIPGKKDKNSNPISKINNQNEETLEKGVGSPQSNSMNAGTPNYTQHGILASTESPAPSNATSITHPVPVLQPNQVQNANAADLAALWKTLITEHYGDYVPPFTKKEFGQLKTFVEGCPAGQSQTKLRTSFVLGAVGGDICRRVGTHETADQCPPFGG